MLQHLLERRSVDFPAPPRASALARLTSREQVFPGKGADGLLRRLTLASPRDGCATRRGLWRTHEIVTCATSFASHASVAGERYAVSVQKSVAYCSTSLLHLSSGGSSHAGLAKSSSVTPTTLSSSPIPHSLRIRRLKLSFRVVSWGWRRTFT